MSYESVGFIGNLFSSSPEKEAKQKEGAQSLKNMFRGLLGMPKTRTETVISHQYKDGKWTEVVKEIEVPITEPTGRSTSLLSKQEPSAQQAVRKGLPTWLSATLLIGGITAGFYLIKNR